jgi:GH15 family glucan-1,4-alpha-glucosidase
LKTTRSSAIAKPWHWSAATVDWLGLPRFDSAACFAALLGDPQHGRWLIAPIAGGARTTRRYRGDTLILETIFETETGAACVIDFMSHRDGVSDLVRIVRGRSGTVAMQTELIVRLEYGSVVPWVSRKEDGRLEFTAGPDRLLQDATVPLRGVDFRTVGEFNVTDTPFDMGLRHAAVILARLKFR